MSNYKEDIKEVVDRLIKKYKSKESNAFYETIASSPSKDFESCRIGIEKDNAGEVKSLHFLIEITSDLFSTLSSKSLETIFENLSVSGYDCVVTPAPNPLFPNQDLYKILIKLNYFGDADIYLLVVSNILSGIAKKLDENGLFTLIELLGKWKSYFEPTSGDRPLSHEQQIGLWGELYVLKNLIDSAPSGMALADIVGIWLGPENSPQDFLCETNAIEVKTLYKKNVIKISSLEQLDLEGLDALLLSVLRLKEGAEGEEEVFSLFALVNHLQGMLSSEEFAETEFIRKLKSAKYDGKWHDEYDKETYSLESESRYRIDESLGVISRNREAAFITRASYSIDVKNEVFNEASFDTTISNLEFLKDGME